MPEKPNFVYIMTDQHRADWLGCMGHPVVKTPYYGYQHVDLVTGYGDQCGGNYEQWFRANCPDWQALTDPADELPHDYTCPQVHRTPIPKAAYPTTWIGDRAID